MQLGRLVERQLLVLALFCVVGGALLPAVASRTWPRYQAWVALPIPYDTDELVTRRPAGRDPWGRPWAEHSRARLDRWSGLEAGWTARSLGPDGVDDRGFGDDVVLGRADRSLGLVEAAAPLGALLALAFLWLAATWSSLRGGRGPEPWHDALRAAVAATVPAAAVAVAVALAGVPRLLSDLKLLVPPPVALVGAAWLLGTLAALGWRVRPGVPRRRRARPGLGLAAGLAWFVALGAAVEGLWRHGQGQFERERSVTTRARFGDEDAVGGALSGDRAGLDDFLALEPEVEWQLLHRFALEGVARLGPAANPHLARALRWSGGGPDLAPFPWCCLLAWDRRLETLAEAVAREPGRYPTLLLARPTLLAALLGAAPVRAELDALARQEASSPEWPRTTRVLIDAGRAPWRSPFDPTLSEPQAEDFRRRAREAAPLLAGGGDAWVVVDATGLRSLRAELGCACVLDGAAVEGRAAEREGRVLVVLGPFAAVPAGRRLVVRDLSTGRAVDVELPAQAASETLWVEARLDAGVSDVRAISRPAVRSR